MIVFIFYFKNIYNIYGYCYLLFIGKKFSFY